MEIKAALAGNPNSGKTTLFNALTGSRQHVGNYPGVTVERKEGVISFKDSKIRLVDLPGTYSLTAYSLEEVVSRDFLVNEKPEAVINIVDATNLERNLYLTVQLLELGVPVMLALNMMDVAQKQGINIDIKKLSKKLNLPVIPTVARSGKGKEELLSACFEMIGKDKKREILNISYGTDIDEALVTMTEIISESGLMAEKYPARWLSIKYLESDEQIIDLIKKSDPIVEEKLEKTASKLKKHLRDSLQASPEMIIADYRYGFIRSISQDIIGYQKDINRFDISDKLDRVFINRFAGPLIMLGVIFALYKITFTYSEVPIGWVESFFGWIRGIADTSLQDGLFKSLIISGIIDGVGGVLGFVPLIMFMFLGIAFIEDSGYLARVAFMLDRVFRIFGLHGSSVMAFIVSGGIAGGCAVPGIMASRTLKSPKERLATLLTVPFMNCGAKLPVFALLVAAFFAENQAVMMFIITMISWLGALLAAKLLRVTVIKGKSSPFVMELPPYRLPTFKGLIIHTWERTWQYIKKAGTVILAISVILWAMMTFPSLPESKIAADENKQAEKALSYSLAGRIGKSIEPVTSAAGFDWRTNIALIGGFAAKEVVVSTLGTAYSLGEIDPEDTQTLSSRLAASSDWDPLKALSLIIFTIFYAPCFVSVVCIVRESGSYKWGGFSILFNTSIAFMLSAAVYQFGRLLGF